MKRQKSPHCLRHARAYCEEHGLKLTEQRALVLEIIASSGKPVGAYDILARLAAKMENPKPPTVYRAIGFLEANGFVHRIESLNAYMPCCADHRHQGAQFLICDSCGAVAEAHAHDMPESMARETKSEGFRPSRWNIEIHGLCKSCAA